MPDRDSDVRLDIKQTSAEIPYLIGMDHVAKMLGGKPGKMFTGFSFALLCFKSFILST